MAIFQFTFMKMVSLPLDKFFESFMVHWCKTFLRRYSLIIYCFGTIYYSF